MELEVRGTTGSQRERLRSRVESHRAELKRLTQEFQLAKKPREETIDLSFDDAFENVVTEDQRRRLLDTSERIDRTGRTLQNGYRMVLETEEIGSHVLKDLHDQRETIQRSRGRVSANRLLFSSNQIFVRCIYFFYFSCVKQMLNLEEARGFYLE